MTARHRSDTRSRLRHLALTLVAGALLVHLAGCSCSAEPDLLPPIDLPEPSSPWCEPVERATVRGSGVTVIYSGTIDVGGVGDSIAHGDFDGDTWPDLALGAPRSRTDGRDEAGAVVVCWGAENTQAGAPAGSGWFDLDGCSAYAVTGLGVDWHWGAELAALPTSDGHALVVAAPGRPVGQESWAEVDGLVFRDDGTGRREVDTGRSWVLRSELPFGGDADVRYGSALAVADIDDDDISELAIGVPGYDQVDNSGGTVVNAGAVEVFWGIGAPLGGAPPFDTSIGGQVRLGPESLAPDVGVGKSLAFGHFDHDRNLSLAIGGGLAGSMPGGVAFSPAASTWVPSDDFLPLTAELSLEVGPTDAVPPGPAGEVAWDIGPGDYLSHVDDRYAHDLAVVRFDDAILPDIEQYRDPPRDMLVVGAPGAAMDVDGNTTLEADVGVVCLVRRVDELSEVHQWCEDGTRINEQGVLTGIELQRGRELGYSVDASFHLPVPGRFAAWTESFEVAAGAPGWDSGTGPGSLSDVGASVLLSFRLPAFALVGDWLVWDENAGEDGDWVVGEEDVDIRDLEPPEPRHWTSTYRGTDPGYGADARFGQALASADLDSLGNDDLVIGVPGDGRGGAWLGKTDFPGPLSAESGYYHLDFEVPEPTEEDPFPWNDAWFGSSADLLVLHVVGSGVGSGQDDQPAVSLWSETNHVLTLSYGMNGDGEVPPPDHTGWNWIDDLHSCMEFPLNSVSLRPGMGDILFLHDVSWDPDEFAWTGCGPSVPGPFTPAGSWPDYTGTVRSDALDCDPDDAGTVDYTIAVGAPKPRRTYDLDPMQRCGYPPEAEDFPTVSFDKENVMSPATIPGELASGGVPPVTLTLPAGNVLNAAFSGVDLLGYTVEIDESAEIVFTVDFPSGSEATLSWDLQPPAADAVTVLDSNGDKAGLLIWLAPNQAPIEDLSWTLTRSSVLPVCE